VPERSNRAALEVCVEASRHRWKHRVGTFFALPLVRMAAKSQPGPPMPLNAATAAQVRLIIWCRECGRPDQRENGTVGSKL
jgi:hypothetical protein